MNRSRTLSDYLRRQAWWRLNRVEHDDGVAHARSALALLDAAAYAARVPGDDPVIVSLEQQGCFGLDGFTPGDEARRVIRNWHFAEPGGEPWELVTALPNLVQQSRAHCRAAT